MIYTTNWGDPKKDTELFLSKLWNVEYYNMWNIKEGAAIAYLLDKLNETRPQSEYMDMAENLFLTINNITWNEFSFLVAYKTNDLLDKDESIDLIDLKRARQRCDQVVSDCKTRKATSFWLLDAKYAPEWFHEMWPSLIDHQESKMRERFIEKFNEMNLANESAEQWYRTFKNQDPMLLYELDQCLKHKRYKENFALVYQEKDGSFTTAKDLSKEYPDESIMGIYIRMFLLRE